MLDFNEFLQDAETSDDSFELLYSSFFTPIYRYLFTRLGDREVAMDLAQNVFIKAFQHYETLRQDHALRYLYTIARNQLIDHLRKKHTVRLEDFDQFVERVVDDSIVNPEIMGQRGDKVIQIRGMLATLPESQREAITLRYIQELDYDEMEMITGKSAEALRQAVSRGLQKLKTYYHYE